MYWGLVYLEWFPSFFVACSFDFGISRFFLLPVPLHVPHLERTTLNFGVLCVFIFFMWFIIIVWLITQHNKNILIISLKSLYWPQVFRKKYLNLVIVTQWSWERKLAVKEGCKGLMGLWLGEVMLTMWWRLKGREWVDWQPWESNYQRFWLPVRGYNLEGHQGRRVLMWRGCNYS